MYARCGGPQEALNKADSRRNVMVTLTLHVNGKAHLIAETVCGYSGSPQHAQEL